MSVRLLSLLTVATAVRLVFFTGPLGSDEVVYVERALDIVRGTWSNSDYIGGVRYGVNIPLAILLALFGNKESVANLFALLPSVAEVGVVYWFARRIWGPREALLAGLVLAFLPLHVHLAGRLAHDPANALFITLTFVFFYLGEQHGERKWFVLAGLAAGAAFWIREVSIIFVSVFALYALMYRRWSTRWIWAAAAGSALVAMNLALFWWLTDDPFHGLRTLKQSGLAGWTDLGRYVGDPSVYFWHLLVDVKHTWLTGLLAAAAVVVWIARGEREERSTTGYVALWAAGMLLLFSFLPASLHPLLFIRKQTNYMALFVAPLALLAGYALARIPRTSVRAAAVVIVIAGSLVLCALEQQVIHVETGISKAAVLYAGRHPNEVVFSNGRAANVSMYYRMLDVRGVPPAVIHLLGPSSANGQTVTSREPGLAGQRVVVIVGPPSTGGASNSEPVHVMSCWQRIGEIEPVGFGIGQRVVEGLAGIARHMPSRLRQSAELRIRLLEPPAPAPVYAVPPGCRLTES